MPGSLLRQAVRNSTASSMGAVATFAAALLFAGFRIRILGVERAGYMMLLDGITSMTAVVGGFGLGTAAIRKMAVLQGRRELSGVRVTLGAVLFAGIAVGAAVAGLTVLAFPWIFKWSRMGVAFRVDAFGATALTGLSFLARQVYTSYETVLPAFQRYDLIALVNSLFSFLTSGLGFLTVLLYPAMTPLALLVFSLSVIRALAGIALARYLTGRVVLPRPDLTELLSMGAFGGWAYAVSFSNLLTGVADRMALTTLLGSRSLPYYVIGQNVIKKIHALIAGQSDFLFPMLAGAGEHTGAVVKRVQDRLRWFVTFVSAALYGGLALMAYPLLDKLVGPGFARLAFLPFVLACCQGFLWSIDIVPYQVSWAEGRGAPNAVLSFIQGALVIGTLFMIVPRLGVLGASLAQLWAGITGLCWVFWVDRQGGRFTLRGLFRPLVSPMLMMAVCLLGTWAAVKTHAGGWEPFFAVAALTMGISVFLAASVEKVLFARYRCIETAKTAAGVLLSYARLTWKQSAVSRD